MTGASSPGSARCWASGRSPARRFFISSKTERAELNERTHAMTIKVGDKIPSVKLWQVTPEGVKDITTDDLFRGKRVALFAVPGAYTRTCSQRHLPSYVTNAAALKGKGIDAVACVAVNDAFVMDAWGKEHGAGEIMMLG